MKKFTILSGLWLFLLSPVFLCAQVTVNRIQYPDPYAICQVNEILYELESANGQWPNEISLQYSLGNIPLNSNACIAGNPSRLFATNISVLNQSNPLDTYPAQYNESTATVTIDLSMIGTGINVLELSYAIFIDCSVVPSNTNQSEMELIQLNETISDGINQIAVFVNSVGAIFFSGLQAIGSPFYLNDPFGNITANFQVTPTLTAGLSSIDVQVKVRLYNQNTGLSDDCVNSDNAELTYELPGGSPQIIPENQWVTITINSGQPIGFSKTYQVNCAQDCGNLRAEFEWKCPELIAIQDYQCTICQNATVASFTVEDNRSLLVNMSLICPITLNDLSCPGDTTVWLYRLINNGEIELQNIELTLSKLAPNNGPNVLTLIDRASINISRAPGNTIQCTQSNDELESILNQYPCNFTVLEDVEHTNPNAYFTSRYNVHKYRVRIDELAPNDTIIFKFITERSAQISFSDETNIFASPGLHYNKYYISHYAEDGCGNSLSGSGELSGQATYGDVAPNANLVLNYEPLVTDLSVAPGSPIGADGQSATLDVRLRGIYHGQNVNSLMYRHYHGVNNANLLGMLRVDVLCDPGLRITETDLTQVTMFSDDGALLQWPVAGISYNPIQEGTCEATAYSFYFNFEDLPQPFQTFTHNSFLRFRLTSCCPTVPNPSFFPEYQVNFYMMTNNENCYDDGQFVYPNNCGGNLLDCANAANNVVSCADCLWLPLTGVTEDFNLHCPGCNSPGMIITNYEMKRSTFGFEDFNDNRVADNTGVNPIPIDNDYDRYEFLNHHGSNFGDILVDTLAAWFFDGPTFVPGYDPDTSGFSYDNNMIAGSNDLVLRFLQLNRFIPEMNTMNVKLKSFKFFIDAALNDPALSCCECEDFYSPQQISDGRQTIFMLERSGDSEMAPYVQRIVNGEDGNYFFTFDAQELLGSPLGFVDCTGAGNLFDGYYADQTFRLVCEYEVCGNFLPASVPATIQNTRRPSEISNQMWLAGVAQNYTAFANIPDKPDYVSDVLLFPDNSTSYGELDSLTGELIFEESFIEDFIFWCETYSGMHYFYSVYSVNFHPNPGNPTPETLQDWCTKEFNTPSRLFIGHGNTFRYEFKIPPLDLNHLRLNVPANWEVERILYTTRNFNADNFVEIDFNTALGSETLTSGMHFINASNPDFEFPPLVPLDDINALQDSIQVVGDEQLLQAFRFRMKPTDCVPRTSIRIENCFLTSFFDNTNLFSDTTNCAVSSVNDTIDCKVMVSGNLNGYYFPSMPLRSPNPNLTVNVNPSLEIAEADTVCWNVSFNNQNISNQTTAAPFVFIEVPQSAYIDNNSWNMVSGGNTYYPVDGYFQIAQNLGNTINNVVLYSGQLCASMNQCFEDTVNFENIDMVYGWNCGSFPPSGMFYDAIGNDTIYSICNQDTITLSLEGAVAAAVFEGAFNEVAGCNELIVEFTLTSIDNGFIYPSGFTLTTLPAGLSVSSVQVSNNAGYTDLDLVELSSLVWEFETIDLFGLQGNIPGVGNQEVVIIVHFNTDCSYNGEIPMMSIVFVNYCQELSELFFPPAGTSQFTLVDFDGCSPTCNICDELSISSFNNGCNYEFTANLPVYEECDSLLLEWNFGDGNIGTGNPLTHSFLTSGNYIVNFTYTCFNQESQVIFSCTDSLEVETNCNQVCSPEFQITQLSNCCFHFEDLTPDVIPCEIGGWGIFQNGNWVATYLNTASFEHCFTDEGVYQVCNTVCCDDGLTEKVCYEVEVWGSCDPVCEEFLIDVQSSSCNDFSFTAVLPAGIDSTINFCWWIGYDNQVVCDNSGELFHQYQLGTYLVCYTVWYIDPITNQVMDCKVCTQIEVNCEPSCDGFGLSVIDQRDCEYTFEAVTPQNFNGTTTGYCWWIGYDNIVECSGNSTMTHLYPTGTYEVCYTVWYTVANSKETVECKVCKTFEIDCNTKLDDYCFVIENADFIDEVRAIAPHTKGKYVIAGTHMRDAENPDFYTAIIAGDLTSSGAYWSGESVEDGEHFDVPNSIVIKDKMIFTVGHTTNKESGNVDVYINCVDEISGALLWSNKYGADGLDVGVKILDMKDENNQLLVVGYSNLKKDQTNFDIFAMIIKTDGSVVGMNVYTPSELDYDEFASDAIKLAKKDEFVISGYQKSENRDMLVLKIDDELNPIGTMTFVGDDANEVAYGLVEKDEFLYLVGSTDKVNSEDHVYLAEINKSNLEPSGENSVYIYEKGTIIANKITLGHDGNLIVAGTLYNSNEEIHQGIVIKLISDPKKSDFLDIIWSGRTESEFGARFNHLISLSKNEIIAVGAYSVSQEDDEKLMVNIEALTGESCCLIPFELKNENYLLYELDDIKHDSIVWNPVKYGDIKKLYTPKLICEEKKETKISVTNYQENAGFIVYPNPNSGSFVVELLNEQDHFKSVELFDLSGRKIESKFFQFDNVGQRMVEFNVNQINSGMYLIRVDGQFGVKTGRVSIMK